jgi:D-alanyl-D-alanine carboxypeptidase/D-alanyl-D-alanine-endopeptidase (penicillin-binding protein 4)
VWDDKNYCYAAPISASIINHNCLPFKIAPSKVSGGPAHVLTSSKYFYPSFRNAVVTSAKRPRNCGLKVSTNSNSTIGLDGCMSKGRYEWGVSYVVTDIPEYNRNLFKTQLSRMGIDVYGTVTFGSSTKNLSMIGSHASKPLRDLIKEMLKKSDNIIAGALFKKVGQLYSGKPGSWENGSLAVANILAKNAGMSKSGLRLLDGSGLSPDNLVTPTQMMQVLDYAYHHDHISSDFITSLPIAGVDGTLKHRMWNIARRVRAKTGTISGVVSLAGYVMTVDQEPLAFVIMINGSKGLGWRYKAMEDNIATALSRYKRSG